MIGHAQYRRCTNARGDNASTARRFPDALKRIYGTWLLWAGFCLYVVLVKLDDAPVLGSVFYAYREAALHWLAGQDLYVDLAHFNYFPPSAVFFVPFAPLPFSIGGAVWRALNIAVFALGIWRLSSLGEAERAPSRFLVTSVLTILLSGSAARYGQATLAMAGLMMLATADVERDAPWRAAILIALAVALKPLAVVLMLVLVVVYPRLLGRTVLALACLFLLPFLLQHPAYVVRQYLAVPGMLVTRADQPSVWEHIFGLFDTLGWITTTFEQTVMRGAGAVVVLLLCWRVKLRSRPIGIAFALYALTTCYILLFGSGTERNTYAMMAPIIGLLIATSLDTEDRPLLGFMAALAVITLFSNTLKHAYPGTPLTMVKPFVCSVLFVNVSWLVFSARSMGVPKTTRRNVAIPPPAEATTDARR